MTETFETPDGSVRLVRQDALEFLRGLPDKAVDVVVTSPPYNKGKRDSKSYGFRARRRSDSNVAKWATIGYQDEKPEPEYELFLQWVLWQCLRVSKGVVCLNHQLVGRDRFARHPLFLLHPFRDRLWAEIIWDRRGSMQFNARKHALSHESIFAFGKPHWWNQAEVSKKTVWRITPRRNAPHACAWPVELPKRLIEAYCPEGGTVCDPFAGIATAGVAAFETGRRFVGCDNDARTFEAAKREIVRATERYALFGSEWAHTLPMPQAKLPQQLALEFAA
ncbi:MAG: site-specific DNA-methyltransferase [Patescibacteria group bacterium]|nr:site-specific DNA-methyltransferase [Patescibacteria group bacterium]